MQMCIVGEGVTHDLSASTILATFSVIRKEGS